MDPFYEYCQTHLSSLDKIKSYYKRHEQYINKNDSCTK